MTTTVTITIGRNVGNIPLDSRSWERFRQSVSDALTAGSAETWAQATYVGAWEGVSEDAAIWLAAVPADRLGALRAALGALASLYRQDAIGLTVGTGELVVRHQEVTTAA